MSLKICAVCDEPILRGEPKVYVADLPIHLYCDIESDGTPVCDTPECQLRWCVHAGECIV